MSAPDSKRRGFVGLPATIGLLTFAVVAACTLAAFSLDPQGRGMFNDPGFPHPYHLGDSRVAHYAVIGVPVLALVIAVVRLFVGWTRGLVAVGTALLVTGLIIGALPFGYPTRQRCASVLGFGADPRGDRAEACYDARQVVAFDLWVIGAGAAALVGLGVGVASRRRPR